MSVAQTQQYIQQLELHRQKLLEWPKLKQAKRRLQEVKVVLRDSTQKAKRLNEEYDKLNKEYEVLSSEQDMASAKCAELEASVRTQEFEFSTIDYEINLLAFHKGQCVRSSDFQGFVTQDELALRKLQEIKKMEITLKATKQQLNKQKKELDSIKRKLTGVLKQMNSVCNQIQCCNDLKSAVESEKNSLKQEIDTCASEVKKTEQAIANQKFELAKLIVIDFDQKRGSPTR